jgi:hypothetical protein
MAMSSNRVQLATGVRRIAALALASITLAGCQGVTGSQPFTQVRVIDTSPDAPNLDIYQNSQATLYNVGFGTVSSYIPTLPGSTVHVAVTAGTQQQLAQIRGSFAPGTQYTLLAGNVAANFQLNLLKDQSTPAPAGQVALRFLSQATRTGPVDLYLLPSGSSLTSLTPIAAGLSFGGNTGYLNASSGTYSIVAFPAGAAPGVSTPTFTSSQASYPAGSVRTLVLIDQVQAQTGATSSLQLITADDYDPTL